MRRKTLKEKAHKAAETGRCTTGYSPLMCKGCYAGGWIAGHRVGKREGKAEAMKACGWGDGERRK